jgi:hypothetical protein
MSLEGARQALLAGLEAAGIRTYYGWGPFATPCARVFPGEPWVSLGGTQGGKRRQRYEIWAVMGRTDAGGTFDELEALVQQIDAALEMLNEFGHAEWHKPIRVDMSGTNYLASRGVVETLTEV